MSNYYYLLLAVFMCIGGLVMWVWWLDGELKRMRKVVDEHNIHLGIVNAHLEIHDERWRRANKGI